MNYTANTNLTYRTLKQYLDQLTEQELDMNVAVLSQDQEEVFPVLGTAHNSEQELGELLDILDPAHPLLIIQ